MINKKKLIGDFQGTGKHYVVPYSRKFTSGKEVNIAKYSGLVSVIKRRSSSEIANDWSKNVFGNSFSATKYTAKIPAVIARHTYVLETILSKINLLNKEICDFGAGEGDFLTMLKKKLAVKHLALNLQKKIVNFLEKIKLKILMELLNNFTRQTKKRNLILALLCGPYAIPQIVSKL
tara:strand:+ start:169 stop:699 length:531 start_codon:yes stop_codon:yes gene_type:complete